MKKLIRLLSPRLILCGLLIFVQIFAYVFMLCCLSAYSPYINTALFIISLVFAIAIVGDDMNSSFKLAWIVVLLTLPLFAWIFYLILGRRQLSLSKRRKYAKIKAKRAHDSDESSVLLSEIEKIDTSVAKQCRFFLSSGERLFKGTRTTFYRSGEDFFPDFIEALNSAEKFIFLEYFIIAEGEMWNEVFSVLKKKAAYGVDVRILYDDLGTIALLPGDFDKELVRSGIKACIFNRLHPSVDVFLNYRDHRKIAVIDGKIGFTGGVNISDEYINLTSPHGYWKDYALRLEGDAVHSFSEMFMELWEFSGNECDEPDYVAYCNNGDGYVLPFADGPMNTRLIGKMSYTNMINSACNYVYIVTPYLILDSEIVAVLMLSAQNGIDVRIITPHIPDKRYVHAVTRANYSALIKAGVRIFEFTKGFVHGKSIVSDDKTAIIGTTNFDFRSFYLHFENGVFLYNTSSVGKIKKDFTDMLLDCTEITRDYIDNQGIFKRFGYAFIRLFSPLL